MMQSCVHTHTVFCDGKSTMEEMAAAARNAGIKTLGFSGHSYDYTDDFGIKNEDMPAYRSEAERVRRLFDGEPDVLCGIELDNFTHDEFDLSGLDYVICSVHGVFDTDGRKHVIDGSPKRLLQAVDEGFGGSFKRLYTAYYEQYVAFINKKKPDIAGHFDLITKYNEKFSFFDDRSDGYKELALSALDAVLDTDAVLELNTGAIARGHRSLPYPADFLLERILQRNGKVIITTDAHSADKLIYWAAEAEDYLKAIGFKDVYELGRNGFYGRRL